MDSSAANGSSIKLHFTKQIVDFYMGANSPDGFFSYYSEFEKAAVGWRSFLIKGGAGTGKSTVMKRVLSECDYDEQLIERLHCSSDPKSLDGIVMYRKKFTMVDATPPHIIEPRFPGGYQSIINLCEYFDEDRLCYRLRNTIHWQEENNAWHKRCQNYLKCAKLLQDENIAFANSATDKEKVLKLAARICKREIIPQKDEYIPHNKTEHKRLLSAVTNQGVTLFADTATTLADKIYLIKDEFGVSSNLLLTNISQQALQKGYEIFSCYCPLDPQNKLEHLFIPALNLGFVTENKFHSFKNIAPFCVISAARFTDKEKLSQRKQIIRFNQKAINQMVDEAIFALKQAKTVHDSLELQYACAVDFTKINAKMAEVIAKINLRGSWLF